jgi:ketosteroid isomerase-like protein
MQYQSSLDREGLTELAINKYFASVDRKDLDAVMDCFHDNAMLTTQTAFTTHAGKDNIRRMFVDFMSAFDVIVHRDFTCTVDEDNGRIVASFVAELTDKDGTKTYLENTNFWRIRGDKFQEVYVYMSGENVLV